MKKLILSVALLLTSAIACANPLSQLGVEKSYIELNTITINSDLDIHYMKKAKWAPEIKVGAELGNGLYTDESIFALTKDKFGVLADFGFGYKTGIVTPYIATYYDKSPATTYSKSHEDLGYEVGLSVNLHNKIRPWVQGDDVVSLKKARLRLGVEADLNKNIAIEAGYAFKSKEKGNQLELGVGYIL